MRIVVYNLCEGLRGRDGEVDPRRAAHARAVVARLSPDVLILNEALYAVPVDGRHTDYAALFGLPHKAVHRYDGAWGNCILSRFPIRDASPPEGRRRQGLKVRLALPDGEVTVATLHPHPDRPAARKALDFKRLVAGIDGPFVLGGDFNAISPDDPIDEAAIVNGFRRFTHKGDPRAKAMRLVEAGRAVFPVLTELGLHDAVPPGGRRYTVPTDRLSLLKDTAVRIDHLLVNDAVEVRDGFVHHDRDSQCASDHHPVVLDCTLKDGAAG